MSSADGPALLAAAVRAAILAKGPRRTVQAVAASVTSALVRRSAFAMPVAKDQVRAEAIGAPLQAASGASAEEELVAALREARRAKRRRKRANRAARTVPDPVVVPTAEVSPAPPVPTESMGQFLARVQPTSSPASADLAVSIHCSGCWEPLPVWRACSSHHLCLHCAGNFPGAFHALQHQPGGSTAIGRVVDGERTGPDAMDVSPAADGPGAIDQPDIGVTFHQALKAFNEGTFTFPGGADTVTGTNLVGTGVNHRGTFT